MYVKKLSRKRYNSKKLRKSKRTTRRRRLIKKRGGDFCYNFTNNLREMIGICEEQLAIERNLYEDVETVANGDEFKSHILEKGLIEKEYKRLQDHRFGLNTYKKLSISEKINEIKKKLEDECFKKLEENEQNDREKHYEAQRSNPHLGPPPPFTKDLIYGARWPCCPAPEGIINKNDTLNRLFKNKIRNILKDPVRKVELINQANEYSKKTQKKWIKMVNKLEKELKIEN